MSTLPTIKVALLNAARQLVDSDSRQLDSEVLLAHTLDKSRSYFRAWPEKQLSAGDVNAFNQLIEKRKTGTPIAYLVGYKEFWSRSFSVTSDVLIPRPDTELLIDITLQKFDTHQSLNILDLGTGSGIIAITLALELPHSNVTAVDSCPRALAIAQKNAQQLQANNASFIQSHWFESIPNTAFDIIISNPPYIDASDPHLFEGDVQFEPTSALISPDEGLEDIQLITTAAINFLKPGGILLFEHGFQQDESVKNLLKSSGFTAIEQHQDIQQHTRATLGVTR